MAAGTRRLTGGQPTCSRGLTASTWPPPTVSTARWGPARMMVPQLNTTLPAVTPMGMGRLETEKKKKKSELFRNVMSFLISTC
mgnify:CR=1 FL=1